MTLSGFLRVRPLVALGLLGAGLAVASILAASARVGAVPSPALDAPRVLCGVGGGCDTVIRVEGVERTIRLGTPPDRFPADGLFYVVTARIVALHDSTSLPIGVLVRDAEGRTYGRAWDVEARLPPPPAGRVRWVFDLPDRIPGPHLVLHRPGLLNRLLESVEIPLPAFGS